MNDKRSMHNRRVGTTWNIGKNQTCKNNTEKQEMKYPMIK
jgi:hypothetical protein